MRPSTVRHLSAQGWPNTRLAEFLDELAARDRARAEDAAASAVPEGDVMRCATCGLVQPDAERCTDCGEHRAW